MMVSASIPDNSLQMVPPGAYPQGYPGPVMRDSAIAAVAGDPPIHLLGDALDSFAPARKIHPFFTWAAVCLFAIMLIAACVGSSLVILLSTPVIDGLTLVTHRNASDIEQQVFRDGAMATLRYTTILPFEADAPESFFDQINVAAINAAPYTPQERSHLWDVRDIISTALLVTYALVLVNMLIVSLTKHLVFARRSLLIAGISCVVLPLLIAALLLLNFDGSFTLFHELLFPQGNWTFISSSLLITIFPTMFWQMCGLVWMALLLLQGAFLIVISRFCGKKYAWKAIKA